jgi:hypothetical protein
VAQRDVEDVGERYEQLSVSVVVEDGDGRGRCRWRGVERADCRAEQEERAEMTDGRAVVGEGEIVKIATLRRG